MRIGLCAFLCLAVSASFAGAQGLDKAKLRQSIEMPALSTSFGVQFRSSERDGKGNKYDPEKKLAEMQKKLTGTADDAETLFEMRGIYLECLKDEKKGKEMVDKAESVLRPILQTTDPKQAHLVTLYGSVLEILKDNPWTDCEAWASRAVSVGPQDWRTWAYLAHARHQQIPTILCGGDETRLPKERRTQTVIGMLYQGRFRPEHVDQAEKALNEALQYHDKAKELAANDPKRQIRRYGFRLAEVVLRDGISVYRGQKPAYPKLQFERVVLDELQVAAQLNHDHLLWHSQLAHHLIMLGWHDSRDNSGRPAKAFRPSRVEDEPVIRAALARMEKLTEGASAEATVFCYSILAALHSSMQENAAVEKIARKMLQLEPANQLASEHLQQALLVQGRHADQLVAAQALAKELPSPRNHFILAKALALNNRDDLAEHACLEGLKKEAGNAHCLLGMTALMMRKGDGAVTLKVAWELLDKASPACRPEAGSNLVADLDYLSAIHQALSGEAGFACIKLQRLQLEDATNARYEKALAVIGR
ncbi:MAG: hypothetical protein EXR98_11000 [Gemmataceae bacterium]|nr:hypothetical protein [Gemmataceae bacterium]